MQPTSIRLRARHALTVAAALLVASTEAMAQTAPAASGEAAKSELVVRLDDFVVTSSKVSGYRATNSITATGIGMAVGDTPLTVNVVTKDLIQDTRADLITDTIRFVPSVMAGPTNESFTSVRGFFGGYSLRNGVFRRQNLTTWNVDRVEVIQGPSGIFYSNVRPGGLINYITTKPVLGRTFADVSVAGGTNGYYRGEGAFNVALGDVGAIRAVVGNLNDNTFRKDFNEEQDFVSAAGLWNIAPDHQIILELFSERTTRKNSYPSYPILLTNSRYWNNPVAIASNQSVTAWMAANFPGQPAYDMFAPFAPASDDPYGRETPIWYDSFTSSYNRTVDLNYNGKLTDSLALSVIGNKAYENTQGINPAIGDPFADGTFRNFVADWFINIREIENLNAKLVYKTEFAGMKHTLMAGYDNQWVTQKFPLFNGNINLRGPVIAVYNPRTDRISARDQFGNPSNSRNTVRQREEYYGGAFIVDQMMAFQDRLSLLAGARRVEYEQELSYIITRPGATTPTAPPVFNVNKWTPQFGALYKIGGGVAVFGSLSRSVEPQTFIDITSRRTVEPIESKGYDLGVKLNALNGALTGTINYYYIDRSNVAIFDTVANNAAGIPGGSIVAYYQYGNAQRSRGLQADVNWSVTNSLQLLAGWNHFFQVENIAPQANPLMVGIPLAGQTPDTVFLWSKYEPVEGSLKGFMVGGGVRYSSDTPYGDNFNANGITLPSFAVVDLMFGYKAKIFERSVDIRLNVKNALDKEYREGGNGFNGFGHPRRFILSASTRF